MGVAGFGLRRWAYWGSRHLPLRWLRWIPGPIGVLCGRLVLTKRRQIRAVLHWTTGSAVATDTVFAHFAHCLTESLAAGRQRPELSVLGGQELLRWQGQVPGAVLLTAHTGAWDVAAAALGAQHGIALELVVRPEQDVRASELHATLRAQEGVQTLSPAQPAEAIGLLNRLQRGHWVALQADRGAPSGRSLKVRLFGRSFEMPRGPFQLARLAGAPLIPVFNARMGFLQYEVEVFPARVLPPGASEAELLQAAQYVAECLERFVSRHPTQWFHFCEPPQA